MKRRFFRPSGTFALDGPTVVNGVLTIPLPGTNSSTSQSSSSIAPSQPGVGLGEFIAGDENLLAAAAFKPLLEGADNCAASNPLILYGPHGCGKSHLASGLVQWWQVRHPHAVVTSLTGTDFTRELADAINHGQIDQWRANIRASELFVLEDLGEITNKPTAQDELAATLDALEDREAMVVITARTLPTQWSALSAPLRSRLSAALAVPLAYPARATRRMILERLAEWRKLPLPRRALDGLVDGLSGSVPRLASAILELELAARVDGETVDPADVRTLVKSRDKDSAPKLREIARLTAKHFGLKLADLKSPDRRRSLVAARCVAMYLTRQLTSCSLCEIGNFFGGRDHTTVLHGCQRTEKLLRQDRAMRLAVSEIRKMLAAA